MMKDTGKAQKWLKNYMKKMLETVGFVVHIFLF